MFSSKMLTIAAATRRRAAVLSALGATSLVLLAAGPASATPKQTGTPRKGCTIYSIASGVTYTVPDGTTVTRTSKRPTHHGAHQHLGTTDLIRRMRWPVSTCTSFQ